MEEVYTLNTLIVYHQVMRVISLDAYLKVSATLIWTIQTIVVF